MTGSLLNRQTLMVRLFRINSHAEVRVLNHNYMNQEENRKSETFEENNIPISNERKYFFSSFGFRPSITKGALRASVL